MSSRQLNEVVQEKHAESNDNLKVEEDLWHTKLFDFYPGSAALVPPIVILATYWHSLPNRGVDGIMMGE
ncbi:hypothetical protein TNCT_79511 [Trichonephila clavata]|uniref:Uncharacterized protein n=1 Tax=Trichonephila clavata TaxID=2740835 RepID=A0A8X6KRK8_TRICU|nr:hypothetical protein TNCT_79511 [Trichonephila clavata]